MSPDAIRLFLGLFAAYIAAKAATAPRRGTFRTLFGVVEQNKRPRLFQGCLVTSYLLAILSGVLVLFLPQLLVS